MSTFRRKFIGTRAFYASVLALLVPMIVQQGITQFVNLLDNVMVGRLGTTPMSGNSTAMTAVAEMSWEMMLMKVPTELRMEAAMPAPSPYSLRIMPTRVGQPCRRRGTT